MLSTYHAMLQECGMKGLQNSFVATKSSSLSPNTCEGAANFALPVNQHSKVSVWSCFHAAASDVNANKCCESVFYYIHLKQKCIFRQ